MEVNPVLTNPRTNLKISFHLGMAILKADVLLNPWEYLTVECNSKQYFQVKISMRMYYLLKKIDMGEETK